jgi:putative membrane protein
LVARRDAALIAGMSELAPAAGVAVNCGCVSPAVDEAAIFAIQRPDRSLWTYYLLGCLVVPPLFPFLVLPAWFRYSTMRYTFTAEGISMRWGILFRREVIIQYARIQDIHLRSNVVERWLGLARVLVQTASGNAGAEMTLEGLKEFEAVRDFLYTRMRGVRGEAPPPGLLRATPGPAPAAAEGELVAVLREVAEELRAVRLGLGRGAPADDRRARDV